MPCVSETLNLVLCLVGTARVFQDRLCIHRTACEKAQSTFGHEPQGMVGVSQCYPDSGWGPLGLEAAPPTRVWAEEGQIFVPVKLAPWGRSLC